ncbi:hypothetical protein Afil01_10650 [Actinorhabdospora filicis]|uniref:Antitoxin n=1 Tax=Actinorhabdospora filicis TaxID=1785913 RepID=A0A9W6SHU4_9ACTN|nr:hypothetical protein [Actinorhabdospora filicis]GLZ76258.1 hypothetical protein Afil01_10650 [Actinorhabdospora filicis]
MREVSEQQFIDDPYGMLRRVEAGESFAVTRRGEVVAMVRPTTSSASRYAALTADGKLRLAPLTTRDLARFPRIEVPEGVSLLEMLLQEREGDGR